MSINYGELTREIILDLLGRGMTHRQLHEGSGVSMTTLTSIMREHTEHSITARTYARLRAYARGGTQMTAKQIRLKGAILSAPDLRQMRQDVQEAYGMAQHCQRNADRAYAFGGEHADKLADKTGAAERWDEYERLERTYREERHRRLSAADLPD